MKLINRALIMSLMILFSAAYSAMAEMFEVVDDNGNGTLVYTACATNRAGYKFEEWRTVSSTSVWITDISKYTKSVTSETCVDGHIGEASTCAGSSTYKVVHAKYSLITFTAKFKSAAGESSIESDITKTITMPTGVSNWIGNNKSYTPGTSHPVSEFWNDQYWNGTWEITFTAQYKVTLNKQGGTGGTDDVTMTYGDNPPTITPPTKYGYDFQGYYTDQNGKGTQYYDEDGNGKKKWDADVTTLYAYWKVKKITVTFNKYGSNVGTAELPVTYGEKPKNITPPEWDEWIFNGYYLDNEENLLWDSVGTWLGGNWVYPLPDDDCEVYPKRTPKEVRIKFDINNGQWYHGYDTLQTIKTTATNDVVLPNCELFKRDGYKFTGWAKDENSEKEFDPNVSYEVYDKDSNGNIVDSFGNSKSQTVTLYACWKYLGVDVVFHGNGGIIENEFATYTNTYYKESTYGKFPTVEYDKHKFLGWFTAAIDGYKKSIDDYVDGDVKDLYAQWEAYKYYVKFDGGEGGTGTMDVQALQFDTPKKLSPNKFVRTGYTFNVWTNSLGAAYEDEQSVANVFDYVEDNSTNTLYATWSTNTYTVSYDANGGTWNSFYCLVCGNELGYTNLGGWRCPKCGNRDQTKMDFTRRGPAEETHKYDQIWTITDIKPVNDNPLMQFVGWQCKETGETYESGVVVSNLTAEADGSVELKAVWEIDVGDYSRALGCDNLRFYDDDEKTTDGQWKVDYNDHPQTSTSSLSSVGNKSQLIVKFTTSGKLTFWWKGENVLGHEWTISSKTNAISSGGSRLYNTIWSESYLINNEEWNQWSTNIIASADNPQWIEILHDDSSSFALADVKFEPDQDSCYWVKYDGNGGEGEMKVQEFAFGVPQYLFTNQFVRTGYAFLEWLNEKKECVYDDGEAVYDVFGEDFTVGATGVLSAVWSPNNYTVKFLSNGGVGSMDDQTFVYDDGQNLRANEFEKEGYTFEGWRIDNNGEMILDGASFNLATNDGAVVELYAQWKQGKYYVEFDGNGGVGSMAVQEFGFGDVTNLPPNQYVRTGYTFLGWTNTIANCVHSDADKVCNIFGIVEIGSTNPLKAIWRPNNYTVKFLSNGGTGAQMDDLPFVYDVEQALSSNSYTKTGHTFVRWKFGETSFDDGAIVSNLTTNDNETIELLAQWEINKYEVDIDGVITNIEYGQSVTSSVPKVVSNEYMNCECMGWRGTGSVPSSGTETQVIFNVTNDSTLRWLYLTNCWVSIQAGENGSIAVTDASGNAITNELWVTAVTNLTIVATPNDGWKFSGWTNDVGATVSTAASFTLAVDAPRLLTAVFVEDTPPPPTPEPDHYQSIVDEVTGTPEVDSAAVTYDGYLYDEAEGSVVGTIQVKAAKAKVNRTTDATTSKLTITIQLVDETKKISISGDYDLDDTLEQSFTTKGRTISIILGSDAMKGSFEGYAFEGLVSGSSADDYIGTYNLIADEGTFTISVAKNGKVKVSGKTAEGKSVSVTTYIIAGNESACIPVVISKYDLAFAVWFEGEEMSVKGLTNAHIGAIGTLIDDAVFTLNADELAEMIGDDTYADYFPVDVPVAQDGKKWIVANGAKAGKVVLTRDKSGVDETKAGDNPSALKLTYTAKSGTFKGSFKVYRDVNDKPSALSATVTGVMIDGIGYGSATIKKFGTIDIVIK